MNDIETHLFITIHADMKIKCISSGENTCNASSLLSYLESLPTKEIKSECDPKNRMCEQVHFNRISGKNQSGKNISGNNH